MLFKEATFTGSLHSYRDQLVREELTPFNTRASSQLQVGVGFMYEHTSLPLGLKTATLFEIVN